MELFCNDLIELPYLAKSIVAFNSKSMIWLFEGEMGAGKTTIIKAVCKELGVTDQVSSPTYSIVNEYINKDNSPIYHFDFYRLNNEEEALDIGIEEYFYSGNYCFIEWSSKIPSLIPKKYAKIEINLSITNQRVIHLSTHG